MFEPALDPLHFQNQLQGLMQSGQLPTEAVQQEMKDYMEKIQASPIVNEFFTKQQQLSIYLADLEKIIFEPIQDLYK